MTKAQLSSRIAGLSESLECGDGGVRGDFREALAEVNALEVEVAHLRGAVAVLERIAHQGLGTWDQERSCTMGDTGEPWEHWATIAENWLKAHGIGTMTKERKYAINIHPDGEQCFGDYCNGPGCADTQIVEVVPRINAQQQLEAAEEALKRAHAALDKGHDHTAETWADRQRLTAAKLIGEGGS